MSTSAFGVEHIVKTAAAVPIRAVGVLQARAQRAKTLLEVNGKVPEALRRGPTWADIKGAHPPGRLK